MALTAAHQVWQIQVVGWLTVLFLPKLMYSSVVTNLFKKEAQRKSDEEELDKMKMGEGKVLKAAIEKVKSRENIEIGLCKRICIAIEASFSCCTCKKSKTYRMLEEA